VRHSAPASGGVTGRAASRLFAASAKRRDPRWQNPPGTGDINNFALIYVTNNAEHTEAFQSVGFPVVFDSTITYEFTYDSTGESGELYEH
jgi:hypothetical protein